MPEEDDAPEGGDQKFTQADVDRILSDRLKREGSKYADYDELKAKAAQFDEAAEANKTELQKLQDQLAERDAKIADLPKQTRAQVLRFASLATSKGFVDAEDALVLIGDIDLSDDDAVGKALDDLAQRKPHLVKAPTKQLKKRPAAAKGDEATTEDSDLGEGKQRAAEALRSFARGRP